MLLCDLKMLTCMFVLLGVILFLHFLWQTEPCWFSHMSWQHFPGFPHPLLNHIALYCGLPWAIHYYILKSEFYFNALVF